jgi:hypothetical protein
MFAALGFTILLIFLILGAAPANLVAQERYLVSYNGFGVGQAHPYGRPRTSVSLRNMD